MDFLTKRTFYTDGACSGNPGSGGWAYVELDEASKSIISFSYENNIQNTTNNRMELQAILAVCDLIKSDSFQDETSYIIYSDSSYCVQLINIWMWDWARNNWHNSKNTKIANKDLVIKLYDFFSQFKYKISVEKVPGHNDLFGNEVADRLASGKIKDIKKLLQNKKYNIDFASVGYLNGQILLNNI